VAVEHGLERAVGFGGGDVDGGRHREAERRSELKRHVQEPAGEALLLLRDAFGCGDRERAVGQREREPDEDHRRQHLHVAPVETERQEQRVSRRCQQRPGQNHRHGAEAVHEARGEGWREHGVDAGDQERQYGAPGRTVASYPGPERLRRR
jgi:hypothetical protein